MQEQIDEGVLPDEANRPDLFHSLPELHYPEELNAAVEMVGKHVESGRGDDVAIYFEGESITYADLQRRVNRVGNVLLDLGVEPGERVFVRFPNRPEYVVSVLAAQKIGAVPVPSMKLLRASEIGYVVEDSGATTAVVYDDLLEEVLEARDERDIDHLEDIVVLGRNDVDHDQHDYDDLTEAADDSLSAHDTKRDDAVLLAYTSGTTGKQKGTLHTHRQMLAIADGYANYCLEPRPEDVFTSNAPLAFTFGYGFLVAFPFRFGASTLIIQDPDPDSLLEGIDEYDVTLMASPPTAYNQMMAGEEQLSDVYDLSSLRMGVSAGEPLPPSTYEKAREQLGIELSDGIGTTEMLHIFISHRLSDEMDPTATGYPVPGYECRVVDPDTGEELPRGEAGLLQVRGPTGITYWDRPDKQRETVTDGWSSPGDIFVHREDGRFEYKSRRGDLIITSGYNVPGPEVEDVLQEREEVYQSAVVGSPDDVRGKIVKAFVVLADGHDPSDDLTESLQEHVKERVAPYKYPRAVEYVDELPSTETGKIKRSTLRERERERTERKRTE
ncbi:benzoate-CoA ligase family protein [Halorubellus sp. JP-L1]|uniref:acyl-CoA synthetase n=1 Tax=Halorubellus sp. JP-L1 TaxID=2715753 RepID=UPI00140D3D37|nr:benzoate-CoA ligase family protein [Halorubellus sp. JP-L1]NHN42912.1 benzoate-CoA ligase family protein [Halorubellus sp. JP-L1]